MLENPLRIVIRDALLTGLAARGFGDVIVEPAAPVTQQGVPTARTITMQSIVDTPLGWPSTKTTYNKTAGQLESDDFQKKITTFQFSAIVAVDPADMTQLTPKDLLDAARAIMQNTVFQQTLLGQGIGLLRVSEIRTPKIKSDSDQYKTEPSFDIMFSHNDKYVVVQPKIENLKTKVIGV